LESFFRVDEVQDHHPRVQLSENGEIVMENADVWWDPPEKEEEDAELVEGNTDIKDTGEVEMEVMNILFVLFFILYYIQIFILI
jgi:hypothetical protein